MNEEIASILEQARLFVLQHSPSDLLTEAVPFAVICLAAGIGLSVLGAKLARFGVTCAFVLLGAYGGVYFAREVAYPAPVCGLVGALMLGIIGFQTFRMWVGVVAAMVLSTVVLGVFGYQRVMPHVMEFERTTPIAVVDPSGSFAVPSPEEQQGYNGRSHEQWGRELWSFVTQRDSQVERNGKALGVLAMVTGLCVGVVAARWALILSTSLVGTSMVTTAVATFLAHAAPASYGALQQRPGLVGAVVGAVLVASLILQTRLTRAASSDKPEASAKS